jgi:hypothetical protein
MQVMKALLIVLALGAGKTKPVPEGKAMLKIDVEPASQVFVDGKSKGTLKQKTIELKPGTHVVRVVHKKDEHEDQVVLKSGSTTEFSWRFEDEKAKPPPTQEEQVGEGNEETAEKGGTTPPVVPEGDKPKLPEKKAEPGDQAPEKPMPKQGKLPKKDPLEGIDAPK